MNKIIMLGTGNGGTIDLYNTCFVIQNEGGGIFLVDTGGSAEIIRRLQKVNINLMDINHIFISHSHIDHILGLIWMFKNVVNGEEHSKINIYCNDVVYDAILGVSKYVLPEKLVNGVLKITNFHILKENEVIEINGVSYTFFDIHAKGTKQFGFECILANNRLVFLGDETINKELYDRVHGADYVMHEAFCLDSEEGVFHAYEKNHSTALSATKTMNDLDVKNLILYHTEETHKENRKRLYTEEAQRVFDGKVIIPDDLEEIVLERKLN